MALFKTRKTDVNQWCCVVLIFCCVFLANLAGRAGRAVRGLLQKQSTSCCTLNSDGFWLIDDLFRNWKKACQTWDLKFLSYDVIVWWWYARLRVSCHGKTKNPVKVRRFSEQFIWCKLRFFSKMLHIFNFMTHLCETFIFGNKTKI